jgi:repressor of nif and glnA expression
MNDLLTSKEDLAEFRDRVSLCRSYIEYDIYNSPHSTEFEELDVLLADAVRKLDQLDKLLEDHVYVFEVTVTVSRRVNVKGSDECEAEQAAMDYAISELDCPIDWNEDDVQVFRDEDEETTRVYDVEV